jgi:hypothetical protein
MKTLKQVEIEPVFMEFFPEVLEDNKVYISEENFVSAHNCLCGCKGKTILPLNHGEGIFKHHGWNLIKHESGKVSFTPSVGNYQFPCKAHYIITKNKANFV